MRLNQAEFLLRELRQKLEVYLKEAKIVPIKSGELWLKQKRGAFVTLNTYPERELRGCIGYIEPAYSLGDIALKATVAAALYDPRFPPLPVHELQNVVLELSILTTPELIKASSPDKLLNSISLGIDGLIVGQDARTGLLLPQVATEHRLSKEEFLSHACIKAGLPPSAWMDSKVSVLKFRAEIFSEESPNGTIIKKQ